MDDDVLKIVRNWLSSIVDIKRKVNAINILNKLIHDESPFFSEPVDCIQWIKIDEIMSNDYNPNIVAPTELKLLQLSLELDGFTQPIIVDKNLSLEKYVIVDGYHRYNIGKIGKLKDKLNGYLPVVIMEAGNVEKKKRMASTIRHNRARGKHQISAMSDIVRNLSRLGWNDERICYELGMESDEVLRLKQIGGLIELFSDEEFSDEWIVR
ncbi:hypothetical protein ACU60T_23220 [Klebsiella aerogenes]